MAVAVDGVAGEEAVGHEQGELAGDAHHLDRARVLEHGPDVAWSFLIRTPDLVEEGLRRVLVERLGTDRVMKTGRALKGSRIRFNPDVVFDHGGAVGDVKYKLSHGDWNRTDMYQVIAFAEAFGSKRGLIARFRTSDRAPLDEAQVGDQIISEFTWRADEHVLPERAAEDFAEAVVTWLDGPIRGS